MLVVSIGLPAIVIFKAGEGGWKFEERLDDGLEVFEVGAEDWWKLCVGMLLEDVVAAFCLVEKNFLFASKFDESDE